jgi:DNA-binding SARP family transcriptional activator
VTPVVRIELLGKLRFMYRQQILGSIGTNRLQSLLAYLVLRSDVPQSREYLAFLLWPESNESQARTNLRQLLHHLRRALPAECSLLVTDNHTARWRSDPGCSIDVVEFEAAVARAAEAEKNGDAATARQALELAAKLYHDDLLPNLYDEWLEGQREQLRQQYTEILGRLAATLEIAGEYPLAIRHATRLVAVDPLRETSYQLLMRLHVRNHDRSSALRVYHQCMRALKRELGVTPAKATQDLFNQALKFEQPAAPAAEPPTSVATAPLPMVGRTTEWQRLLGCWQRAVGGEMHFALIVGEPGVGKSRLAEELFRHCSRHPGASVARARCYFAQGRIAYAPVAEWLRAEPLQAARAQLHRVQLAELARVLPEILVEDPEIPAPAPLTESWQKRHLYEALNAGFGKSAKPLLLYIDDLQWCDYESFEWLHSFFHSPASANTLVLGTARAEEVGRDHPLTGLINELRQSGHLSDCPLAPLTAEEATVLAAQVAGRKCDAAFLSGLYQATGGNPLFVVESVRASLENGSSGSLASPRIQAVIGARLAQLSPAAYELAGLAATIGRPFSFDLLAKATDWDEAGLSGALEELWQRGIVDGQGAGAYDYTHDLLREVAYSELSPIRRRSYHQRVARALEELYAADVQGISGWLAAHYESAGMAEHAIRFYRTAASVAKQRFADAEAADQIRCALRLCRDFPDSARRDQREIELLATLGPSLVTTRGYSMREVGETYERGLELSRRSGERKHNFSLVSGAWLFHIVRGDLEESKRLGQDCIDEGRREGSSAVEMAGRFLLGSSLFHLGQFSASLELIGRATPSNGGRCDPVLALFAGPDLGVFRRAYLSHLYWQFLDTDRSAASSEDSIALARELSHPFSLCIALDYAAMLSAFRQEPEGTLALAEESAALCRKYEFAYYLAWADMLAGWAVAAAGNPAGGLARFRGGLTAFKAMGAELRLPLYYALLAEICGLAGDPGGALASLSSGFAFQSKNGEMWSAPELHRIHGDLLRATGNLSEAQASYKRAIGSARETGARMFEARAAARLAKVSGAQSRTRKATER